MGIKETYYIKEIPYKIAMDIVIEHHYLHRKSPCSFSYGLFEINTDKIIGVITYGKPASPSLCKGICGADESKNVIELTRLFIFDTTPKNTESFFIANTMKLLPFSIIVSYADTSVGHIGYIYQASNFLYTGLSDKHIIWEYEGMGNIHQRHWAKQYGGVKKAKEILGDKLIKKERPRKHRYIYFNCDKKTKKNLLSKLKYNIYNYPKGEI